jgi:hypothetical protein
MIGQEGAPVCDRTLSCAIHYAFLSLSNTSINILKMKVCENINGRKYFMNDKMHHRHCQSMRGYAPWKNDRIFFV